MKKYPILILVLVLFVPLFSQAQIVRQEPLAEVRQDIVFPELLPSEKQLVAEQAQLFLRDLYVHRFDKLDFYPGLEDPVPAIANIVENIDTLTTTEMEEQIYEIFVSQRDLHLNYIFPTPHADYLSFLPLTFERTASRRNFFEVRVNSVNAEQFAEFAPGQRVPEVGDRILIYNGLPILDAVDEQLATAQGANDFGGFSRAIAQMTFVPHLLHLVPEENEVTITLTSSERRFSKRDQYTITLPWIAQWTDTSAEAEFAPSSRFGTQEVKPKKVTAEDFLQGKDMYQELYNEFRTANSLMPESEYPNNPSAEPALTWGVIDNRNGSFGYFRLTTFSPTTGSDATLDEIRRIIFEEFSDTDGLIFDVRDNGGGSIIFADQLSQLFMPTEAEVIEARLLNTDLNRSIWNDSILGLFSNPEWVTVINEVEPDELFTDTVPFTLNPNDLGQAYYRPVAVLPNANSYSATDLFTCAMKDNGAALVYGQDPLTGAGGANVIEHSLFNFLLPETFPTLPGDHRMRVSWRQSVRFGPSEGRIIEDFGCEANFDVSLTKNDILNGNEDQINSITRNLKVRSKLPRYFTSVRPEQFESQLTVTRDNANYDLEVRNTAFIKVTVNGEEVDRIPAFVFGRNARTITVDLPADLEVGNNAVVFEGESFFGRTLWNVKRQFVILEEKVTVPNEGFSIDFADAANVAPLTVVNLNAPENGWNLVTPNLQVGFNPNYADNVNTDAVLLMDLSALESASLNFSMEINTEVGFDFIQVFLTNSAGEVLSLLQESGFIPLTDYTFDISAFAGQDDVQLHFSFVSDTAVTAPGVQLQRFSISTVE